MRHPLQLSFLILVLLFSLQAPAIEPRTEHTYRLAEGEAPPSVSIDQVDWLSGSWKGTAFGKEFEQVWNPPSAESMVGFFKLMDEGKVDFYELLVINQVEGRLTMKVKHFTREFVAWEEKDDYVSFPIVAIEENEIHFSGISFHRVDDDNFIGYIVMRTKDGLKEEKLTYQRVD